MKLPKLHVFQRYARSRRHAQTVAGVDERVGAGMKNAPCTAGGQHRGTRLQNHSLAGFHLKGDYAQYRSIGGAD